MPMLPQDRATLLNFLAMETLPPEVEAEYLRRQKIYHRVFAGPMEPWVLFQLVVEYTYDDLNGVPLSPADAQRVTEAPDGPLVEIDAPEGEADCLSGTQGVNAAPDTEPPAAERLPVHPKDWSVIPAGTRVSAFVEGDLKSGKFEGVGREGRLKIKVAGDDKAFRLIKPGEVAVAHVGGTKVDG